MNTQKHINGILSELIAEEYFVKKGMTVSRPVAKFGEYDLIIDDGVLKSVQVKSIYWDNSKKRFLLSLVTSHIRGNGRRINKKYKKTSFDLLCAVEKISKAIYLIPIENIAGKRSMTFYITDNEKYRVS